MLQPDKEIEAKITCLELAIKQTKLDHTEVLVEAKNYYAWLQEPTPLPQASEQH